MGTNNSFLTEIAKKYNPKIEYVEFCKLPADYLGLAQKRQSVEAYRILIDKDKLACPYRILATLFHEIGHIVLGHLQLEYRYYADSPVKLAKEREADRFAFEKLGIVDGYGRPFIKYKDCYNCIATKSENCLKKKGA